MATLIPELEALEIPPLRIAYQNNLQAIPALDDLEKQEAVFTRIKGQLAQYSREELKPQEKLAYDILQYQLELNSERLALEKQWAQNPPSTIPEGGLSQVENGKAWYAYFLKKWLDNAVSPETMFAFGQQEIDRVKARMRTLQQASGMDSLTYAQYIQKDRFYITEPALVQKTLEDYAERMKHLLPKHFPGMDKIPPAIIARGSNIRLAQVPGYYNGGTFYYNLFDKPFNKRQVAFLYLHEAVPGHHYESIYRRNHIQTPLQNLFYTTGYSEGWAAYVEDIALEIGAYAGPYEELGKWEWDIIRSVRVPLDVGLNYFGWSDDKALKFWQKHITGQDDIARREIARMKRWPCQVITYKYGARKIWQWKTQMEQKPDFDLKEFHRQVLSYGPLPFSILEKLLLATPSD